MPLAENNDPSVKFYTKKKTYVYEKYISIYYACSLAAYDNWENKSLFTQIIKKKTHTFLTFCTSIGI